MIGRFLVCINTSAELPIGRILQFRGNGNSSESVRNGDELVVYILYNWAKGLSIFVCERVIVCAQLALKAKPKFRGESMKYGRQTWYAFLFLFCIFILNLSKLLLIRIFGGNCAATSSSFRRCFSCPLHPPPICFSKPKWALIVFCWCGGLSEYFHFGTAKC